MKYLLVKPNICFKQPTLSPSCKNCHFQNFKFSNKWSKGYNACCLWKEKISFVRNTFINSWKLQILPTKTILFCIENNGVLFLDYKSHISFPVNFSILFVCVCLSICQSDSYLFLTDLDEIRYNIVCRILPLILPKILLF